MENKSSQVSSILDVIGGRESIKFEVSVDLKTMALIFAVIMISAALILYMKKAIL